MKGKIREKFPVFKWYMEQEFDNTNGDLTIEEVEGSFYDAMRHAGAGDFRLKRIRKR